MTHRMGFLMKAFYLLSISAVLIFSGCSKTKEIQEIPTVTQQTKNGADNLLLMNRAKESQSTRQDNLRHMEEAQTFEQKMTHATDFLKAFEYNLWTNDSTIGDNDKYRKRLQLNAIEEFFRAVRENLNTFKDIDDIRPTSDKAEALNLNAIAVGLHKVHDFQELLVEREGITKVSMLSMIKDALKKAEPLSKGLIALADLEDYEKEILYYQEEAKILLNIRYNITSAMALVGVSELQKKFSFLNLEIPSTIKKFGRFVKSWDSKYDGLNFIQQEKINIYLSEAIATRDYMRSVAIEDKLDKKIRKIFSKMKVNEDTCERKCPKDLKNNLKDFNRNIQNILFN